MPKLLPVLLLSVVATGGGGAVPEPRVPVLVELFTSEGCSSCPAADQVLSALVRDQPVAGVTVIALGLHVDYWDRLGWKDIASSAAATARQQDYARVLGAGRTYTPQVVVDGAEETVGSDAASVRRAIAAQAAHPRATVTVSTTRSGQALAMDVAVSSVPSAVHEPVEVFVAVIEDGITSAVSRGENGGRTLHHDAVVRLVAKVGRAENGRLAAQRTVAIQPGWSGSRLSAVTFVQGAKSRRIWGAAAARVQ